MRPLDALVLALGLSVLALCSWPTTGATPPPRDAGVAWRLLPSPATR